MQPDTILHNRYRVIYVVDERPNGQLLRARDEQSGALVLLGVLPLAPDQSEDTVLLAKQIATVHHDMLVPLTDHFADGARYILVSEDPGGQDLERALRARGGPIPEQEALEQATKLMQLVEHLHQQKPPLYIGDLWASDLLITERGWRLLPFPLARTVSSSPSPYRAPELADPDVEPSGATDTYALAGLLYHALTGYSPPTAEQQQAGMPLNGPRSLNPSISTLAEQALLRALQQKAANRYQNARELRLALETVHLMAGRSLGLGPDVMRTDSQPAPASAPALVDVPVTGATQVLPATQPIAPAQATYEPEPVAATPQRRGMSTGCLIALALGLAVVVIGIAVALVLALTMNGAFANVGRSINPNAATSDLVPVGPGAISISNIKTITQTAEITGELFGPIAYAPNGKQLAMGVSNGVSLADASLSNTRQLGSHTGDVIAVAFSPDGKLLASAAKDDNSARIWDVASGKLVHALSGHEGWLRSLAFSPDGKLLATGSVDATVRLWNVADGKLLTTFEGHTGWLGNVTFTPDSKTVASTSRDGTLRLWNIATGRERTDLRYTAPLDPSDNKPYWTTGLAISRDGAHIAVGSTDGSIAILNMQTGKQEKRLTGHQGLVVLRGLAFAPDGKTIYSTATDGTVRAWNVETGSEIGQFEGHQLVVIGLALSPDGKQLATISSEEGLVALWNTADRTKTNELRVGQGLITGLAYSPDGKALGITGYTGALKLRLADGKQSVVSPSGSSMEMAFLRGARIGMISDTNQVRLVKAGDGQNTALEGLNGKARSLAANRRGTILAAGSDSGAIVLWDADGRTNKALQTDLPVVAEIALSDDGHYLAAGGPPNAPQIELWDTSNAKRLYTLPGMREGITAMAFQPGGTRLAAVDLAGELFVWDAPQGKVLQIINASDEQSRYTALTFSPDGKLLVGGTLNGELVAWSAADGSEVTNIRIAPQSVLALAFSPDGKQVAASVRNETASVYIFEVPK